jgi:hypothetical protein
MDQDTPGTSVADHPELERLDEVDSSDADESMSEVSHETDESFHEAFDATSLDPALLAAAVTLKDRIASLVLAKVIEWVRSCSPGQSSGNDSPEFGGDVHGDGGGRESGGRGGAGKKRGREDGDGATGPGRGNDGDKDKRRKTEITPAELVPNLACPFVKGYPNKKWPCCEKKGWPSVHRIKYVSHRLKASRAWLILEQGAHLSETQGPDPLRQVLQHIYDRKVAQGSSPRSRPLQSQRTLRDAGD